MFEEVLAGGGFTVVVEVSFGEEGVAGAAVAAGGTDVESGNGRARGTGGGTAEGFSFGTPTGSLTTRFAVFA